MSNETAFQKVIVRPYEETDFDGYFRLQKENPLFHSVDNETLRESVCKSIKTNFVKLFSVLEKETGEYCGVIELRFWDSNEYPEMGITLLAEKQNRGIGTAAIRIFCNDCFDTPGIKTLLVRIEKENDRSRHVFEKLGAKYIGKTLSPILIKLYRELGQPLPNAEQIGANTFLLDIPIIEKGTV